jgi:hypothetical protein
MVKGHMSNHWHRLRPLPAAKLVVHRRYVIKVPNPLPAAPLVRCSGRCVVVNCGYLIVVPKPA